MTQPELLPWHVVTRHAVPDDYAAPNAGEEPQLDVPLRLAGHPERIQMDADKVLSDYGLYPSPAALDLLDAAVTAYAADLRVPRRQTYDGWTRIITLHLSVRELEKWERAAPIFQRMLRFLTGDSWTVTVRQAPEFAEVQQSETNRFATPATATACLFSGGMDSFVGAVNELTGGKIIALVGHHARGGAATSNSQKQTLEVLRKHWSEENAPFFQFWVNAPKGEKSASEITTRGRSILFLALGIASAQALAKAQGSAYGTLVVPENGFISLNVPLTASRRGSFSTRTTHPYLMELARQLNSALEIPVEIELPFRFFTKGEVLQHCANPAVLQSALAVTMSCSHPGVGRWSKQGVQHCGRCIPCLVRRAAIATIGADPTLYRTVNLTAPIKPEAGSDLRALRLALDRTARHPPRYTDILASGPLPVTDGDKKKFFEMFCRSIEELRRLVPIPATNAP